MNRKLTFEPLGSRLMLSGADYLGWQLNLGSTAEFPEYDMNYDGTVNAADLAPALESEKAWLAEPRTPDNPPTPPQGLIRLPDQMDYLFDDHTVFAAMQNYPGNRVKHVPQDHALWIEVLDVILPVEGTIRYHQRGNGDLSVQADLKSAAGEIGLTAYRRNILVKPNGDVLNLSGRTSFRGPNDIYNAEIIDDGWMLQKRHHTEHANGIDADWTEWHHRGQKIEKNGYHETTSENVISINPLRRIEETETQRKEWTGPCDPTTETLDRTTGTYRIHERYTLMESSVVLDKDTTTAYDEEMHEGLWLNLARDQDVVTDTTTEEYGVSATSTILLSTNKEVDTEHWNYSVLEFITSLQIYDRVDPIEPTFNILTYYNSNTDMDFSRSFVFEENYPDQLLEFAVTHNDDELSFLILTNTSGDVARYAIGADTFGIDTSDELREVVEQLAAIEQTLLPEGMEANYPEIEDVPVLGV